VKLESSGQETIPASPETVWAFITNPEKVGYCLPDVSAIKVHDPTHFDASVKVAVGPVRGSFTLKVELHPDPATRHIDITVSGGGFGSTVDLIASADVVDGGDGTTVLNRRGTAEMRGTVAAVGSRVLDAQAQKLIAQTFANIRQKLTAVTA
jgi:carbon monoxide dehydrogenase subunit G